MAFNAAVGWSAGHGNGSQGAGFDPGMDSPYVSNEANVVQGMAARLSKDTAALGIPTFFRDTGYFNQADDDAAKLDCEDFIELHLDAGPNKAHGTGGFIDSTEDAGDRRLATAIVKRVAALGFTDRGVRHANYAVLRDHAGMHAALIEIVFGTSASDVKLFNKKVDEVEKAILNGYLASIGRKPVKMLPRKTVRGKVRLASGKYLRTK